MHTLKGLFKLFATQPLVNKVEYLLLRLFPGHFTGLFPGCFTGLFPSFFPDRFYGVRIGQFVQSHVTYLLPVFPEKIREYVARYAPTVPRRQKQG
jgi:hypothetical protein